MKTKSAATLTIHGAPAMHVKGRKNIAAWLRRQAGFLERNSEQLSRRFTARYLYEPKRRHCKIDLRKPKERRAIEALIGVAMRKEM